MLDLNGGNRLLFQHHKIPENDPRCVDVALCGVVGILLPGVA